MNKKPTVTIGIPAYNEEANIKNLLEALLSQKKIGYVLEKIIVVSDGSTDSTVKTARSVKDKKIKVVNRKARKGIGYTQNEITKMAKSGILVLMDADVLPEGRLFLKKLIQPIKKNEEVGMVSADLLNLPPRNLIEKALANSHEIKNEIYKKINYGNNIYKCHGVARALSKSLYKRIVWPKDSGEDAFSYLFCIESGYKFMFEKRARVFFRSPSSVQGHAKQSNRFYSSIGNMSKRFGGKVVEKSYFIPKKLLLEAFFRLFFKYPESAFIYSFLMIYIKVFYGNKFATNRYRSISASSKNLLTN